MVPSMVLVNHCVQDFGFVACRFSQLHTACCLVVVQLRSGAVIMVLLYFVLLREEIVQASLGVKRRQDRVC